MQMPSTLCLLYNKDDDDESTLSILLYLSVRKTHLSDFSFKIATSLGVIYEVHTLK